MSLMLPVPMSLVAWGLGSFLVADDHHGLVELGQVPDDPLEISRGYLGGSAVVGLGDAKVFLVWFHHLHLAAGELLLVGQLEHEGGDAGPVLGLGEFLAITARLASPGRQLLVFSSGTLAASSSRSLSGSIFFNCVMDLSFLVSGFWCSSTILVILISIYLREFSFSSNVFLTPEFLSRSFLIL